MKKLYYSMGEVTKLTGLEAHTLRSWEKIYSELKPKKNSAGNRAYREHEIELIFQIKELLFEKKYSAEGVKKIIKGEISENENGRSSVSAETKRDLAEIRIFLNDLL